MKTYLAISERGRKKRNIAIGIHEIGYDGKVKSHVIPDLYIPIGSNGITTQTIKDKVEEVLSKTEITSTDQYQILFVFGEGLNYFQIHTNTSSLSAYEKAEMEFDDLLNSDPDFNYAKNEFIQWVNETYQPTEANEIYEIFTEHFTRIITLDGAKENYKMIEMYKELAIILTKQLSSSFPQSSFLESLKKINTLSFFNIYEHATTFYDGYQNEIKLFYLWFNNKISKKYQIVNTHIENVHTTLDVAIVQTIGKMFLHILKKEILYR